MSDISKIQVGETLYDVKDQTARDNFTNAKITTINNLSDDNHIPTAKSVYDYFNNQKTTSVDNGTNYNKLPTSGSVYNFINNKITSSISSSSTDSQIPTARAVYDYIQNNGGGSSGGTSSSSTAKINPEEYYTIQTMHLDASNLNEDQMFDGMYKLSDYTEHDGVYKFTDLNSGKVEYSYAYSMGGLAGAEMGVSNMEVYIISNECGLAYIFPQDAHLVIPNDEEGTVEMTLPAGFYLGVETEDYMCTVQHLKKQDNYIVQKRQSIQFDENALMGAFHKVSDNTDYSGLYSAQTIGADSNGNGLTALYDCGGYFEPIENVYPEFAGFPAYALTSSASIHKQGVPAAAIFTQSFTVPAGAAGNDEEMFISAGTYMLAFELPYVILELVKLQEKEEILDIDALFGSTLEHGSFTETLNTQIFSTGSALLNLTHNDFNENIISTETIYNMFNSAFENGGNIKIKLHGTFGDAYTNMLCPTTLWKSNNQIGAAATLTLYTNSTWITYNLQIYSSKSYFSIYCKGLAAQ